MFVAHAPCRAHLLPLPLMSLSNAPRPSQLSSFDSFAPRRPFILFAQTSRAPWFVHWIPQLDYPRFLFGLPTYLPRPVRGLDRRAAHPTRLPVPVPKFPSPPRPDQIGWCHLLHAQFQVLVWIAQLRSLYVYGAAAAAAPRSYHLRHTFTFARLPRLPFTTTTTFTYPAHSSMSLTLCKRARAAHRTRTPRYCRAHFALQHAAPHQARTHETHGSVRAVPPRAHTPATRRMSPAAA